jgi:hypothetical protein
MKFRVFVTLAAVGVGLSSLLAEPAGASPYVPLGRFGDDEGKPKKKDKPKDKPENKPDKARDKTAAKKEKDEPIAAGEIKKRVALAPKGMRFGMSLESVAKLYDKVFEDEFVPLYKKAEPGMQMQTLDSELAEKKALLRRNKIEFGRLPTGEDQGPRKGEYSYNNGESMSRLTLKSGTQRIVYFFSDKLWKIYDEHKLRAGGPLGADYKEAVGILTKKFGIAPVMSQPDFAKGRNFEEAWWKDSTTIIRAVNRGPVLAMVYVDRSVQENLSSMRKQHAEDPHEMDRDVAAVTKKSEPEVDEKKKKEDAAAAAKKAKKKK